jgi:hypothetical protein
MKGVKDRTLDDNIMEYVQSVNCKSPPYFPTISDVGRKLRKNPYTIRYRLLALVKAGKLTKVESKQFLQGKKKIGYIVADDAAVKSTSDLCPSIHDATPEDQLFNCLRFNGEEPCQCQACGKNTTSGVHININPKLGQDKAELYGVPFKCPLIFCNDCWISPEMEAFLNDEEG